MNTARLLASASIAALLAACSSAGQSVAPTQAPVTPQTSQRGDLTPLSLFSARSTETGSIVHVLPTRDIVNAARSLSPRGTVRANSGGNLQWGHGPVQHPPAIYVVFWGNWSTSDAVYNRVINFFNVTGGSAWQNSTTQYSDSTGHVTNPTGELKQTWIDNSYIPSHPGSSAVGNEALRAVSHFGYKGSDANYIVALAQGHDPHGFAVQWCAWHSSESSSSGTVSYTNLPYMPDGGASCGANSVNSNGTLDGVTIVGGHEEAETITDPQPSTGWTDSGGSENGDKCAWINLEDNPSVKNYPTQPLWSNATNGGSCVQSYP